MGDIREQTILVDKAVGEGQEAPPKSGSRFMPLAEPLRADLMDHKVHSDRRANDDLVFPGHTGGYWSRTEFNNWRGRVWKAVMARLAEGDRSLAHLAQARPYDCRGSFVSLEIRERASPVQVAQWAGHSTAVMFKHYANVIQELGGQGTRTCGSTDQGPRETVAHESSEALDEMVVELMGEQEEHFDS